MERETLRYRLESLRKAKCIMVAQKERVRVSQTNLGTEHTSLPKLDPCTPSQSCDKQSSKKKTASEMTIMQPQGVEDIGLPWQDHKATLQKQHETEIKQQKEELTARQMVMS